MRRNKKFTSEKLTRGINTILLDQELVQRMCSKSSLLFGSKWRWRVMCGRNMIDPLELEKRFDIVIEQQLNKMKEQFTNEQSNTDQQLGNDDGRSATTGIREGDGINGQSTGESQASLQNTTDGNQVRSGETDDGSTTPSGSK